MTPVLKSQRWSDGYGSDGERTMPKKEIRKRGEREVYYAACRYRGFLLQDSLETTDEKLAVQRLAELKLQIDKGDYRALLWSFLLRLTLLRLWIFPPRHRILRPIQFSKRKCQAIL